MFHTEKRFDVGKGRSFEGNIIAPLGTVQFGKGAKLIGFAFGQRVILGKNAQATLNNVFENFILPSP